jgi:hypothetical protein
VLVAANSLAVRYLYNVERVKLTIVGAVGTALTTTVLPTTTFGQVAVPGNLQSLSNYIHLLLPWWELKLILELPEGTLV